MGGQAHSIAVEQVVDGFYRVAAVREDQHRPFTLSERAIPDLQFCPRFVGFE